MSDKISLKKAERRAFATTFQHGLWDVFIGCFALHFALAPLLSESMGDFWSSAIFLPLYGFVWMAIKMLQKHAIDPRLGTVTFCAARKTRMKIFSLVMVAINILALIAGIVFMLIMNTPPDNVTPSIFLAIILMVGFCTAAYLLDFVRLYVYGLLAGCAPLAGEWLRQNLQVAHHGYPITFGVTAAAMILTGLLIFFRLLIKYPLPHADSSGQE